MKKGPIFDILNNKKLWVSGESKMQFIHAKFIMKFINLLIEKDIKNEIFNITGFPHVKLIDLFPNIAYPQLPVVNQNISVKKANLIMQMPSSEESIKEILCN